MQDYSTRNSQDSQNPFKTNEFNKSMRFIMGQSFQDSPITPNKAFNDTSKLNSNIAKSEDSPAFSSYGLSGISNPFTNSESKRDKDTAFKSAVESPSASLHNSPFFEDKFTNSDSEHYQKQSKLSIFSDSYGEGNDIYARSNSLDEVVSKVLELDNANNKQESFVDASDSIVDEKLNVDCNIKTKKTLNWIILISLLFFMMVSCTISSLPVFTCTKSDRICVPQLTIQLTDKSPAARTALLTVREALKVLSYLAIDFGDISDGGQLDFMNDNLDNYYQDKVIDSFSVNTIYQLNFMGYCRLSSKDLNFFCMKSNGFDILSVFVRDAGAQLGELTKTNVNIMGDSFAIAYELAITGFNELMNRNGSSDSKEYVDWAILLQKFSKGVSFLSFAQFIVDGVFLCGILGFIITLLVENRVTSRKGAKFRIVQRIKKWLIIPLTLLGFLNLLMSFLVCSLSLEYLLKLSDLATSVGIANVNSGLGFILIWVSFGLHISSLIFIVYLANSFRKSLI